MKRASWGFSRLRRTRRLAADQQVLQRWRPLLFAIGAVVAAGISAAAMAAESVFNIATAEFVLSGATEPPPPTTAGWQAQSLPDAWADSRPVVKETSGWYRLRFDLAQKPDQPWATYIAKVRPAAAVFVNDVMIGQTDPVDRLQVQRYPQYFLIPPSALRAGSNELLLHVYGKGLHGLTAVRVGEEFAVRPVYERRYFWQVTGVQFCSAFAAVWGVFSVLLWLRRRDDRMYLYFGLSAFCWAIYTSFGFVRFWSVPPPWLWALFSLGAFGKLFMMAFFALCYAGLARPIVERALWVVFAITMSLIWAGDFGLSSWLGSIEWIYPLFPVLAGYAAIFVYVAWREPSWENALVALAASVHLVNGFYHYVVQHPFGQLPFDYYDFLPLNIVLVWILIDRFIRALGEARQLNVELEGRVAQKHAELEQNYIQLRQMERQQVLAEERQRIMSDMHDGIGGQLISTLGLVEHGELSSKEVAAALRECIEDLRLTIDSLEPTDNDLLAVLGNLRYRLDGRLKACGIELDWNVKEVPKLACLTPQNVLHVLRILQEAFTNVLKHAGADAVSVETGVDAPGRHAYIRVHDNGKGFRGERAGHGLANMMKRAKTIGGELNIDPSPTGTTLQLLLPVG